MATALIVEDNAESCNSFPKQELSTPKVIVALNLG
jgi:hypothetical protein